jgi:hypothetical protein
MTNLPQFLRDMIASPPTHGDPDGGIHGWLFRVCRQLHAHRSPEQMFQLLEALLIDCGRPVPTKEISDAIQHSASCAWRARGSGAVPAIPARGWPALDPELRTRVVQETGRGLPDLWCASSFQYDDDDEACRSVLPILYPGNPLICVAIAKDSPRIAPLNQLIEIAPAFQYLVPSPMVKPVGNNQGGKGSVRCYDTTGPRQYLVVEFDSGDTDEQAAILWHLASKGPLVMVVHSGGKGLRGWFACHGLPDERLRSFFKYSCTLGADDHAWVRCQFDRMPGGTRDDGQRQKIYYFAPEVLIK